MGVMLNLRKHHKRTICACRKCVACCHHKPGMLAPRDLGLIIAKCKPEGLYEGTEANKNWFMTFLYEHFEASPGALVMKDGKFFRIPTIVPKLTDKGCIFLKDDRCTIHDVAPFGCGWFDIHQSEQEAKSLSSNCLRVIMAAFAAEGDQYPLVWHFLKDRGRVSTELAVRQDNLAREIEKIEEEERVQSS